VTNTTPSTPVVIELNAAQVAQVASAANSAGVSAFVADIDPDRLRAAVRPLLDDPLYSDSFLKGLLVLAAFPADGRRLTLSEVDAQFEWSLSTTHRYVRTLVAVGMVEQDPGSRRYRRASW
jgi:hypothetical protein